MEPFEKQGMEEKGIAHVFAGFGYSMAGARVLLREEAARLECFLMTLMVVIFLAVGATWLDYAVLGVIFAAVLCVEALNTAVELIVDRTSPEKSDYGKQTKDIGSFAVFCSLVVFCGYGLIVVLSKFV